MLEAWIIHDCMILGQYCGNLGGLVGDLTWKSAQIWWNFRRKAILTKLLMKTIGMGMILKWFRNIGWILPEFRSTWWWFGIANSSFSFITWVYPIRQFFKTQILLLYVVFELLKKFRDFWMRFEKLFLGTQVRNLDFAVKKKKKKKVV